MMVFINMDRIKFRERNTIIFLTSILVLAACCVFLSFREQQGKNLFYLAPVVRVGRSSGTPAFISTWDTYYSGTSSFNSIKLPLVSSGTYNFSVAWGDGTTSTITTWNQAQITHAFSSSGAYTINITGTIDGWMFNDTGDCQKLVGISQWGCLQFGNTGNYFWGCTNLNLSATDAPDLTGTTTLSNCFRACLVLGSNGNMDSWNVSGVENMSAMFDNARNFNQPIDKWNVSRVNDMDSMFYWAADYNQPIGGWNVANVVNMNNMFWCAKAFNQPIGEWNVSRVINMDSMFEVDLAFNQPLDNWNVSKVTDMQGMFSEATSFDQPLGEWNVTRATNLRNMFFLDELSAPNYDALLLGWSQLVLHHNIAFSAGNSHYSTASMTARATVISKFNWTITDGGVAETPLAPTGLIVTSANFTLKLRWTAPSDDGGYMITNYKIFIGPSSDNETLFKIIGNMVNYTASGLVNGQFYFIKVAGMNLLGTGANTSETAGRPATIPDAPQSFTVVFNNNGEANLTWAAPISDGGGGIDGYLLYIGTNPGAEWLEDDLVNPASHATNYWGTLGIMYYFSISAHNNQGDGPNATTSGMPVGFPGAPQYLVASANNSSFVSLAWTIPITNGGSAIIGYNVYRGSSQGSEILMATLSNVTTWIDTNVTIGQTYYYKVCAVNSIGNGPTSIESWVTFQGPPHGNNPTNPNQAMLLLTLVGIAIMILGVVVSIAIVVRGKKKIQPVEIQSGYAVERPMPPTRNFQENQASPLRDAGLQQKIKPQTCPNCHYMLNLSVKADFCPYCGEPLAMIQPESLPGSNIPVALTRPIPAQAWTQNTGANQAELTSSTKPPSNPSLRNAFTKRRCIGCNRTFELQELAGLDIKNASLFLCKNCNLALTPEQQASLRTISKQSFPLTIGGNILWIFGIIFTINDFMAFSTDTFYFMLGMLCFIAGLALMCVSGNIAKSRRKNFVSQALQMPPSLDPDPN